MINPVLAFITPLILYTLLCVMLASVTYYDALRFPRQGTTAEQRAFHLYRLIPLQVLAVAVYLNIAGVLCLFAYGSVWHALPWLIAVACIFSTAAQDLLYWLWRLALGLSKHWDWTPFGDYQYEKRTNLPLLIFHGGTGPKWLDTTYRLVGWFAAHFVLVSFA